MSRRLVLVLACVCALLSLTAPLASAAEPPNQNDPCSRAGRDTCGTTGVGKYDTYRYGVRWFGDYRKAVPAVAGATWCIDLRFWYPSSDFGYEPRSASGLKNRDGKAVSSTSLRRMSYAIQAAKVAGDSNPGRQGATMLYVHTLMGDGEPGETSPSELGLTAQYDSIARAAAKYAGPYKIQTRKTAKLVYGKAAQLQVRVVAASGALVPGVELDLAGSGAEGLPKTLKTAANGIAKAAFTPNDVKGGLDIAVSSDKLAASTPQLYVPTRGAAVRSGQRLVAPRTAKLSAPVKAAVAPAQLKVTTKADPAAPALLGAAVKDNVTIAGAPAGFKTKVDVALYGPAPSQAALTCTGEPASRVTYEATAGESVTPAFTPTAPGWYGYQLTIPGTDDVAGVTTPCALPEESVKIEAQPAIRTQISAPALDAGAAVTDTAVVTGLGGLTATVTAALYGPYGAPDQIKCDTPPVWTGSFVANGDGSYVTDPVTLPIPGYYTYREAIAASDLIRPVETACAEASETTIVRGAPAITTQVSDQTTAPGDSITDSVVVTGLGKLSAPVVVELWGPYASAAEMTCTGTPVATSTLTAAGDGTYTTEATKLEKAGYYTYRESIAATDAYAGVQTPCGEVSETTIAKATPAVTTVVSGAVVRPGGKLNDTLKVTGLGGTAATVDLELYGPFASRADVDCSGEPYWKGTVAVNGDGTYASEKTTLKDAGFYTYVEKLRSTPLVAGTEGKCGEESETALGAPAVLGGRGDRVAEVRARAAQSSRPVPTRVMLSRVGIDAPVTPIAIDLESGALGIPANVKRTGWWRDGAAPGEKTGTTVIAGHVDSAKQGAGALYALKGARRGDRIQVRTEDGKTRTYRVTARSVMRKAALPTSIYTRKGTPRLVVVTCGGPFDQATGHYRDNIVVTAVPA